MQLHLAIMGIIAASSVQAAPVQKPALPVVDVSSSPCTGAFTVEKYLADLRTSHRKRSEPRIGDFALADGVMRYHAYRALANRDASECDALKDIVYSYQKTKTTTGDFLCRNLYFGSSFDRSVITGNPSKELCAMRLRYAEYPEVEPKDVAPVCQILTERSKVPADLCRGLAPYMKVFPECVAIFSAMQGDDRGCHALPSDSWRGICKDYAGYHKAYYSGKKEDCGDSELCLSLMGDGRKVSEQQTVKLENLFCGKQVRAQ